MYNFLESFLQVCSKHILLYEESYQGSSEMAKERLFWFDLNIIFRVDRTEVGKIVHASPSGWSAEKNHLVKEGKYRYS